MKTAEQIRERITEHKKRVEWWQKDLKKDMTNLQISINRANEDMDCDTTYKLNHHAMAIQKTKDLIKDEQKAIELLEWVLADLSAAA